MQLEELECRVLYAIIVAGKSARFADQAFKRLFGQPTGSPFDVVRAWIKEGVLLQKLQAARVGNYSKIERAYMELVSAKIDLVKCSPEDLEAVHGIGPKTSRFFIIWTRPEARVAVLDVHVLRWLRKQGHDVPKVTPNRKDYARIEKLFLEIVDKAGLTPRQVDEKIWMEGSKSAQYNPIDLRPVA
jgi:thermostable 8-oxoguanine DNA glycosylase